MGTPHSSHLNRELNPLDLPLFVAAPRQMSRRLNQNPSRDLPFQETTQPVQRQRVTGFGTGQFGHRMLEGLASPLGGEFMLELLDGLGSFAGNHKAFPFP